jgi:hypothetical protein
MNSARLASFFNSSFQLFVVQDEHRGYRMRSPDCMRFTVLFCAAAEMVVSGAPSLEDFSST